MNVSNEGILIIFIRQVLVVPEDVGIISAEKLFEFVEVIARSGIYKEIVVDMGNLCNNLFEFISRSNNILMPEAIGGNVGKEKQQKFMDYLGKQI